MSGIVRPSRRASAAGAPLAPSRASRRRASAVGGRSDRFRAVRPQARPGTTPRATAPPWSPPSAAREVRPRAPRGTTAGRRAPPGQASPSPRHRRRRRRGRPVRLPSRRRSASLRCDPRPTQPGPASTRRRRRAARAAADREGDGQVGCREGRRGGTRRPARAQAEGGDTAHGRRRCQRPGAGEGVVRRPQRPGQLLGQGRSSPPTSRACRGGPRRSRDVGPVARTSSVSALAIRRSCSASPTVMASSINNTGTPSTTA